MRTALLAWLVLLETLAMATGCRRSPDAPAPSDTSSVQASPRPAAEAPATPVTVATAAAPKRPVLKPGQKARLVLLTAPWCQWCRVFEHEVLPDPEVKELIEGSFAFEEVNTDAEPQWMDLPGVQGLPTLVFFDAAGRHVLSRSGYRSIAETLLLLEGVLFRLKSEGLSTYKAGPAPLKLATTPMTQAQALAELQRLEKAAFFKVNSSDGGFNSPGRVPYPNMLLELQAWVASGKAPARVAVWISKTVASALRGRSPKLDGEPTPDMDLTAKALVELATSGPQDPRWRQEIERLRNKDSFEGIQDPVDHGIYRYAAGMGWRNPHFERRAADNLRWALLLRQRGDKARAAQVLGFAKATFAAGELVGLSQRSNPFYARLTKEERQGLKIPRVDPMAALHVQAVAARAWPKRCELLLKRVAGDRWPKAHWVPGGGEKADGRRATVDEVGELLLGLASCGDEGRRLGQSLARVIVSAWEKTPWPVVGRRLQRLNRLAAGLCAVASPACGRALATVAGLPLELGFAPPIGALVGSGLGIKR